MASTTVRNFDKNVVEWLRKRAGANKRSSQAEFRDALTRIAPGGSTFDLRALAEGIAEMTPKRKQSNSTLLLRRDRRR